MPNIRKTDVSVTEKLLDTRKDKQKNRQTLIYGTFAAMAGDPKKKQILFIFKENLIAKFYQIF